LQRNRERLLNRPNPGNHVQPLRSAHPAMDRSL
jgi:hypothetical protein